VNALANVAVELRPVRALDCRRVWEWSCSPEVRAVSLNPRPIPLDEHEPWFRARLARPGFWIIEANGADVGVIRIDQVSGSSGDGRTGKLSIAIGSAARGRGIGRRAVAAACAAWRNPVIADVVASNAASRAMFEACGFTVPPGLRSNGAVVTYEWFFSHALERTA
jgi:L-amino acid N-acyltransferase YncA